MVSPFFTAYTRFLWDDSCPSLFVQYFNLFLFFPYFSFSFLLSIFNGVSFRPLATLEVYIRFLLLLFLFLALCSIFRHFLPFTHIPPLAPCWSFLVPLSLTSFFPSPQSRSHAWLDRNLDRHLLLHHSCVVSRLFIYFCAFITNFLLQHFAARIFLPLQLLILVDFPWVDNDLLFLRDLYSVLDGWGQDRT